VYLDFAEEDASAGGYVLLDGPLFAAGVLGLANYPLVALVDAEVPRRRRTGGAPAEQSRDVRTEGLWASITEETPGEHWSVGMEAFAVGYDDPADAAIDGLGDRVALGFDLEWERDGPGWMVYGDVLVGPDRFEIAHPGSITTGPPYRFVPPGMLSG
jgi:hypothetical protein